MRAPTGFIVAGAGSASLAVAMMICLARPSLGDAWSVAPVRLAFALVGVLAVVATDASWRARPWAWRASMALAPPATPHR
ncbi:MAG TPA: hypothetical protein VFJ16_21185 [Longimicrobium sp.]|nr:hypothetical protein [Longimicrobium sp.]